MTKIVYLFLSESLAYSFTSCVALFLTFSFKFHKGFFCKINNKIIIIYYIQ